MKRFLITTCVVLASFGITAGAALADSCSNVSRGGPIPTGDGVITKGNWVWLPSLAIVGEPGLPPLWGFAAPGRLDSELLQMPGANGNYQNTRVTGNQSMLDNSATCTKPGTNNRQTTNGIQSGCL
jgi:hypothetical protein